jgi:Flp pilus assembly protein TadD
LLAALSTPGVSAAQPRDRTERVLARAEALIARDRARAAERLLTRALNRSPTDPRLACRLASLWIPASAEEASSITPQQRARVIAAIEALRRADHRPTGAPTPTPEAAAQACELARLERWGEAIVGDHRASIDELAERTDRLDPAAAQMLAELAALAVRRDDLASAEVAVLAARRAAPADPILIRELALVQLARGRATDAVALLRGWLTHDPHDRESRRHLGGALLQAGRPGEAMHAFAMLAADAPDDASLQLALATAALEAGQAARAERAARRAAELDPADADATLVHAATLLALDRREEAERAYRETLRRRPNDPRARAALESLANTR